MDIEQIIDLKDRSGLFNFFICGKNATKHNLTDIDSIKYYPVEYDLIIIGTPIWGNTMTPAIRTYITHKKPVLKKVAFFFTARSEKFDRCINEINVLFKDNLVASTGISQKKVKEKTEEYNKKLQEFTDQLKSHVNL